jgi:hypothetical protein
MRRITKLVELAFELHALQRLNASRKSLKPRRRAMGMMRRKTATKRRAKRRKKRKRKKRRAIVMMASLAGICQYPYSNPSMSLLSFAPLFALFQEEHET